MIFIRNLDFTNVLRLHLRKANSQNLVIDINREIQELEQGKRTSTYGLRNVKAYNINK
jgi:hypothetical protein